MAAQQLRFKWDQPSSSKGEACGGGGPVCQVGAASESTEPVKTVMMEEVVRRENLIRALKRVCDNKGSPGADGMRVEELKGYLKVHWPGIREKLLQGEYKPQPVKQVILPKPGGTRKLGIPTVLDRFIINHDILMGRIAKRIRDKRILRLIRLFLQAGIMGHGVVQERYQGTPQGGPLSPLLSNILLDELDKELERRGHKFCRYADDCNIYVRTERAGKRVMDSVENFLRKKLKLKINPRKSAVARPQERSS